MLQVIGGDQMVTDKAGAAVFSELEALAEYIRAAKAEISALRPTEVKDEFISSASDELDAIIEATAEATHSIMDAAEAVEEVIGAVDEKAAAQLTNATTMIYEACTFQDITGQRVTKIVDTLKHIEEKVDSLVAAFGDDKDTKKKTRKTASKKTKTTKAKKTADKKKASDEDLLNGPQLSDNAKSQEEIDALFASFD